MIVVHWFACSHTDAPTFGTGDSAAAPTGADSATPPLTEPSGGPVVPGELVISELMPDPYAVDGDFGEYVEVQSIAERELDLEGLTLQDDDGDGFTVTGALVLPVGGRLVFGASDNVGVNGGVPVDYAYDIESFKLGNEGDTIAVLRGTIPIDSVAYEEVSWGLAEGFALNLDPASLDPVANDGLERWCLATSTYGDGDRGTPGAANDPCELDR